MYKALIERQTIRACLDTMARSALTTMAMVRVQAALHRQLPPTQGCYCYRIRIKMLHLGIVLHGVHETGKLD